MLKVSALYIYPVKSLAGIAVEEALVTERGLQHDRRWMVVDSENRFMTMRKYPRMALLQPVVLDNGLEIFVRGNATEKIFVPFSFERKEAEEVVIWNATCGAHRVSSEIDLWFSSFLGVDCRLVYMPEETWRPVDTTSGVKPPGKFTSFADAYPFMMMSKESLEDVNSRTNVEVSMRRFRPSIVFSGGEPYQEDDLKAFRIGDIEFAGLEKCARCNVPNVDPETGTEDSSKEVVKTLSKYRLQDGKVNLGMNLVHSGAGKIKVGDELIF